ncbi:activating signal cointegrator 1 complex subunit 2-like isoform X2 [Tubulanus polymorphus]
MPHQQFWCQVIFDETLHKCIESYLQSAPRYYDENYASCLPLSAVKCHQDIHRRIFMVCLRMATHKESIESHIKPSVFGEIIYENFIFDIPKLMDLCALYKNGNIALLSKMIENIFNQQPKYYDDLRAIVPTLFQVFASVIEQCGVESYSPTDQSPQKLSIGKHELLAKKSVEKLSDILSYLQDTSETLLAFFLVIPTSCRYFYNHEFHIMLSKFYATMVPALKSTIKIHQNESVCMQEALRYKLQRIRTALLDIIHQVLNECTIQEIIKNSGTDQIIEECVEGFLHFWNATLGEKRFIVDFETKFPIEDDFVVLTQSSYFIDETRIEFIMEAIASHFIDSDKKHGKANVVVDRTELSAIGNDNSPTEPNQVELSEGNGACAMRKTGIELESLVSAVKDLLPNLGNGFIEICLEEYQYDVERVINGILEERLPPSLQEIDRQLERNQPTQMSDTGKDILHRHNIYDNDEFDIFNKDSVDLSRIHRGKKDKVDMSLLDEKVDLTNFQPQYNLYANIDADDVFSRDLYEDEYDDTYDDNVGAEDADSADELTSRRPFVIPRALRESEESEEEEENLVQNNKQVIGNIQQEEKRRLDQFIEDPAKVRERNEKRWAAQRRGRGRGGPPRQRDVKGAPKGQGQSEEVSRNRDYKDKHKATRSNHNRRAMADRKRMKGMIP